MRRLIGLIVVFAVAGCASSATDTPTSAGGDVSASAGALPTAGAPSTGAPAGGNPQLPADPCTTLTFDELQTVAGKPFQPGVKTATTSYAECVWTQQDGGGVITVHFEALERGAYDVIAKSSNNPAVPGVGDEAHLVPLINAIDVADGGVEFTVQPVLLSGADWQKVATDLAQLVAGRVGH